MLTRLFIYFLLILFLVTPTAFVVAETAEVSTGQQQVYIENEDGQETVMSLRQSLVRQGVPARPLSLALLYFDMHKEKFANQNYITVIDYRIHSSKDRFFLINLVTGEVTSEVVAHGKGSDQEHDGMAKTFSNEPGSFATSLGFYQVSESYEGLHGYSVRMDGLSVNLNSNARDRAIVIHGAPYVQRGLDKVGRSLGCPALEVGLTTDIINKIKEGSLLFIYAAAFESGLN